MSVLVAFFSAEGKTAKVAKEFASKIGADIFEIIPEKPYTSAEIKWMNPMARCNREQIGKKEVPVAGKIDNFEQYDTIYIGFPIWYGAQPRVINTFCKGYDWAGKKVYAFATSAASGIGKTAAKLTPYVEGALAVDAKLVKSASELENWAKSL
ncbi:flavodoxin [Eubacterium oxidoreducens]|uniref:Flavodoxin n=1 Tax=Eubacterium oxidoreducens TaxID=1732 RepID=A0A1G6A4K7_EUBOX|nr:flavodoxin [Eubacterium oxidoreducens]SDB03186.1 Flavodoxin [Eubacterium oxidoreducens]